MPFIARYRKEATGRLDDTQLRTLEQRLGYLRELEERRTAIRATSSPNASPNAPTCSMRCASGCGRGAGW
ncbi:MAG: hypothetical protein AMXMBFR52_25250 [Burkholderiales bacterium]